MPKTKLRAPDESEQQRFAALLRTMHRAATSSRPASASIARSIATEEALSTADRTHLVQSDPKRFAVYQRLSRQTLEQTLHLEIPLTAACLGASLAKWVGRFREESLSRSALLRDMAYAFAVWACPLWRDDHEVAEFLPDLARFELFEFAVLSAPSTPKPTKAHAVVADRPLLLDSTIRLAYFEYAVHSWPGPTTDKGLEPPARGEVHLLAYRDEHYQFGYIELNPLAFAILRGCILEHLPLQQSMELACLQHQQRLDQDFIRGISEVLESLAAEGIFHGSCAAQDSPNKAMAGSWQKWLVEGKR